MHATAPQTTEHQVPGLDPVHGREAELLAIDTLLAGVAGGPLELVLEGDAGIGKTTLMRVAVRRALDAGMRVLSCTGAASESRLSYVGLADLLVDVDDDALDALPAVQRAALDTALLRGNAPAAPSRWPVVATGVVTLLDALAAETPVLVAVDDVQWLDSSTARALEYAARRVNGPVGLLFARRRHSRGRGAPRLSDRRRVEVRRVDALDDAALTTVLRGHARRPPSRRAQARILEIAGGNPLYALELLRALPDGEAASRPVALPTTLRQMVSTRLASLGPELEELLLAVAALADPTVDVLTRALGRDVPSRLADAEREGVLERRGERVRFTHPLLAEGALARAPATQRRAMHRRLSAVVDDVEDRARQLALAGMLPEALPALDRAARHTRARGAPLAAAELLELALDLGGGTELKVRAAEHHLDAGDVPRAKALLEAATAELPAGEERAQALMLLAELRARDDSFDDARALLEQARAEAGPESPLQVIAGLQLTFIHYSRGALENAAEAGNAALALAEALAVPALLSRALAVTAVIDFARGHGVDERRLDRALSLEDLGLRASNTSRPTVLATVILGFVGRLDEAVAKMERLAAEYVERGEEHDLAWLCSRLAWLQCWRGDLVAAERALAEAEQRLHALGTGSGRILALRARAQVDAYAGRVEQAQAAALEGLELAEAIGWTGAIAWQHMTLGFVELSLGDPAAAAERLAPYAAQAVVSGLPEPTADGAFVHGDAAEALILVGRVCEAAPLVDLLERRGAELERPWVVAVAARCRGLMLASDGHLVAAEHVLRDALAAHRRVPMPVEEARTLLALGRVLRRANKRRDAKRSLDRALAMFEAAGSPRWAEQARDELAALGLRPGPRDSLTPSEERVARMAASGLTNREMGHALQISPRTVDAHLRRVYSKLDIRTRAELGALMAEASPAAVA